MKLIKTLIPILAISLMLPACSQNKKSYDVSLQFGSYTAALYKYPLLKFLLPQANASISSLKFCFKRLRFKAVDQDTAAPDSSADNIDFNLGEVDISSGATSLGTISLPEGTYRRLEFDLENHCASGKSISITNSNGTYSISDRVTIKFSGAFTADSSGVLNLGVQQIIDALNAYNGSTSLKTTAEGISGVLSE